MTRFTRRRLVVAAAAGAAAAALSPLARAQASAAGTVRWVVGYQAGGGMDLVARVIGEAMSKPLGMPVVVDNRPGAAGGIAASHVAGSAADGQTVISLDLGTYALNPHLYQKLTYDPAKDFRMVGTLVTIPFVLFVNASLPVNNLKEFIAYVKTQPPGSMNYASTGLGNPTHLSMEVLQAEAGIRLTHVPYKGVPPALTDLMSGQVQAMFSDPNSTMPHVRSGRLKALAVAMPQRLAPYPDLPTLVESGYKVEVPVWVALGVPAATPSPAVTRLSEALAVALRDPEVVKRLSGVGFAITPRAPAQADSFVKEQLAQWGAFLKPRNIRLD